MHTGRSAFRFIRGLAVDSKSWPPKSRCSRPIAACEPSALRKGDSRELRRQVVAKPGLIASGTVVARGLTLFVSVLDGLGQTRSEFMRATKLCALLLTIALAAPSRADTVTVSISSTTSTWQSTGVVLNPGDLVQISATGLVCNSFNAATQTCRPGAWSSPSCSPYASGGLLCSDFSAGLLGRIGGSGCFCVGESFSSVVTQGGELYLGFNDVAYGDNSGSFTVTITVTPAPPDIQITAAWDRDYYNCGDTASLAVNFTSMSGAGEIEFEVFGDQLYSNETYYLGSNGFSLADQGSVNSQFSFVVPSCLPMKYYFFDLDWFLNGVQQPRMRLPDLLAHDVSGSEIELWMVEGMNCSEVTPFNACAGTAFEMIPFVGIAAALPAEVARRCVMHSYAREGRYKYHNAMNFANGAATLGTTLGPNEWWLKAAGQKLIAKALIIPGAIATGVACGTALGDWIEGLQKTNGSLPVATVFDLADSVAAVMPEVNFPFRHMTIVGNATVTTKVGTAYADADSLGLRDVVDMPLPPLDGYAVFVGANPAAFADPDSNVAAVVELEIVPSSEGEVAVSTAIFDPSGFTTSRYDWLLQGIQPGTTGYLRVGLGYPVLSIRMDYDGDSEVDEWIYPNNTVVGVPALPRTAVLNEAIPNPFNPATILSWTLPLEGHAMLEIFDFKGRLVTTLVDGVVPVGRGQVIWNGTDATGAPVSSGVYLYRLKTADFEDTKRMVLLK
jgi:hypothetical protein